MYNYASFHLKMYTLSDAARSPVLTTSLSRWSMRVVVVNVDFVPYANNAFRAHP